MSANKREQPDLEEQSRADGDSVEERRARNRVKLDAARERARRTVEESRARRRRAVQAWACIGDVPHGVVMAAARERAAADGMSVELAFCMLQGEMQTKH